MMFMRVQLYAAHIGYALHGGFWQMHLTAAPVPALDFLNQLRLTLHMADFWFRAEMRSNTTTKTTCGQGTATDRWLF